MKTFGQSMESVLIVGPCTLCHGNTCTRARNKRVFSSAYMAKSTFTVWVIALFFY